jgi:hypothetical protein
VIRCSWKLVLLACLICAGTALAQESYVIRIKTLTKGETIQVVKTETMQGDVKFMADVGKVIETRETKSVEDFAYQQTILERETSGPATRLQRIYEKAQATAEGKTKDLAYQGKTVLIEKKTGKYIFGIEGGNELTAADAPQLDKEFNRAEDSEHDLLQALLLPRAAVQLGQTWKMDMDKLLKVLLKGDQTVAVDAANSSGTGKLLRVYQRDGRRFGVFEVRLDLPLKGVPENGKIKVAFDAGGHMTMVYHSDICIDGSVPDGELKGTMQMNGTAHVPGPDGKPLKMVLSARGDLHWTGKEITKK